MSLRIPKKVLIQSTYKTVIGNWIFERWYVLSATPWNQTQENDLIVRYLSDQSRIWANTYCPSMVPQYKISRYIFLFDWNLSYVCTCFEGCCGHCSFELDTFRVWTKKLTRTLEPTQWAFGCYGRSFGSDPIALTKKRDKWSGWTVLWIWQEK